jgi:hypothetical protein
MRPGADLVPFRKARHAKDLSAQKPSMSIDLSDGLVVKVA